MRNTIRGLKVLSLVILLAGAVNVLGQETNLNKVPDGQKLKKFKGVVTKREGDWFLMGETMGGPQTAVLLTSTTEVKSHKRGAFRGSKEYSDTFRGPEPELRLWLDGEPLA